MKSFRFECTLILLFLIAISIPLVSVERGKLVRFFTSSEPLRYFDSEMIEESRFIGVIDSIQSWIRFYVLGITPSKRYYLAKDGWFVRLEGKLLEGGEEIQPLHAMGDHLGIDDFSEDDLNLWVERLEARHKFLEERGIKYIVAVVPRKSTIYKEKIFPEKLLRNFKETKAERLSNRLRNHPYLHFVDLIPALKQKALESDSLLYFKTDNHWNSLGAFYAYQEIAKKMKGLFPGKSSPTLNLDQFNLSVNPDWCHKGFSQHTGLCIKEDFPQLIPKMGTPFDFIPVDHNQAKDSYTQNWQGRIVPGHLQTHGITLTGFPSYHKKNTSKKYAHIKNFSESVQLDSALVLCASFGRRLLYLLSTHFKNLYRYRELSGFDPSLLLNKPEKAGFEVVIQIFAPGVINRENMPDNRFLASIN